MERYRVPVEKLKSLCNCDVLNFRTTEEVTSLEGIIGQDRAVKAMDFGLRVNNKGYNIFMAGINGTGKTSYAKTMVSAVAAGGQVPDDWCYVYNFKEPDRPLNINLPPGTGEEFVKAMDTLVEELQKEVPKAFAGDDFENQRRAIREKYQREISQIVLELDKVARERGFVIRQSGKGLVSIPIIDGKPLDQVDQEKITEEITKEIQEKIPQMQKDLDEVMRKMKTLEKEASEELSSIEKKVALSVIKPEVADVKNRFKDFSRIIAFLEEVEEDILDHLNFFKQTEGDQPYNPLMPSLPAENFFARYKINLFVNNSDQQGAPVVIETNPNYYNLFGKIEGRAQFGAVVTDFTMIKSGSLQRANGGYLIIQASEILKDPFAWSALKRALQNQEAPVENIGEQFKVIPTVTIKPEPIPINVKVILIGSPTIQQLLYSLDEEFSKLFKVVAHFDTVMEKSRENILMYSQFVSSVCQRECLKHFDVQAVAKVIEFSSRLAGHQQKLSTRFNEVVEVVYEASAWAAFEGATNVTDAHVKKAIAEKIYRSNLLEEKIQQNMLEGQILIDTEGEVVGQINGLSVYSTGDYSFGKPSKITARTYVGEDGVVNIEREVKMSGQIHDKGVLILSGYLGGKYAQDKPLTLSASLCFEQNYGGVDGDSASCAELVCLLSSITEVPLRQDIAITGSINQRGQVQPIGGVNQKIEGFYALCKDRGLTGSQGVIIPVQNIINLMLDDEVIEEVAEGRFTIYAVSTVDEAIEILTGMQSDQFHEIVNQRLKEMDKRSGADRALSSK
ncbi:MAG: AAA family ATPase [Bacillota bacterium]